MSKKDRKSMVESGNKALSISRQCSLLGISRSSWYYKPRSIKPMDLELMRLIDEQYLKAPVYGTRRMTAYLWSLGYKVNRKRVQRLMRLMGIEAIYPKPRTSRPGAGHRIYPYLLKDIDICIPNQVWCTDITYIPMPRGFMYLVVIMDWHSRKVLSWSVSNTLDADFCISALRRAIAKYGCPEIFNSDQGSQFTSARFTTVLEQNGIKISMDGRGRFHDNIFIERLWRSVKYECVYINAFTDGKELREGLSHWFSWYNKERLHQSLGYKTPDEVYYHEHGLLKAA